jgi:ArsR family transcriptional regulator
MLTITSRTSEPRRRRRASAGDVELARLAKAVGHPARVRILRRLGQQASCCHGSLADQLLLAPSTVSQHLRILREAGLVQGEVDGPRTSYCINRERVPRQQRCSTASSRPRPRVVPVITRPHLRYPARPKGTAMTPTFADAGGAMTTLEIFDPPMCSTGVCGPDLTPPAAVRSRPRMARHARGASRAITSPRTRLPSWRTRR